MTYGPGSYCDLKTRLTLIVMPERELDFDLDPIEMKFNELIAEIDFQLDYYESSHLEHAAMQIKSALGLYQFFRTEDFAEYED